MENRTNHIKLTNHGNKRNYNYWNLATWNVKGVNKKSQELTKEFEKYHIDVAILSEIKKKKGKRFFTNWKLLDDLFRR